MSNGFDPDVFRKQFPEFSDPTKYPDAMLQLYWDTATMFMATEDCPCAILQGPRRVAALNMLTAHLLALAQSRLPVEEGGSGTGGQGGYETSASIGDVSVSNMAPPAKDGWQFFLTQTPYGQQLWALLSLLAVGGVSYGGLPERQGFRKVGGVFW